MKAKFVFGLVPTMSRISNGIPYSLRLNNFSRKTPSKQGIIAGLFVAAFYFPMFGKVLPVLRDQQETFVDYGAPLAILSAVLASLLLPKPNDWTKRLKN